MLGMSARALSRVLVRPMQANADGMLLASCRRLTTLHSHQSHQHRHLRYGSVEAQPSRKSRAYRSTTVMSYGGRSSRG
eukprot:6385983-Pyramimonas_sp.AAC.2